MKKRLIFNFYIDEQWKENHMNKIHLCCLSYYKDVFDEMNFMVSLNDIQNKELIYDFEKHIMSLELCPNIRFMVKQNHIFRESKNFYDEIALKLNDLDGLTFFAHNKGITNYVDDDLPKDGIEKWVTSMYYGCLCDINEVENFLTDGRLISYGSLLNHCKKDVTEESKYKNCQYYLGKTMCSYLGTFFWINTPVLYDYINNTEKNIPKLNDRWYDENFLSNLIDFNFMGSYRGRYILGIFDMYLNAEECIKLFFGEDYNNYRIFHQIIINKI